MNFRDLFDPLDESPDALLATDEEKATACGQAFVDGDLRLHARLRQERATWQCEVLTRWWHLPPPRWTGPVH